MSTERPYAGRHRARHAAARRPVRRFQAGIALPTTAAATIVAGAVSASVLDLQSAGSVSDSVLGFASWSEAETTGTATAVTDQTAELEKLNDDVTDRRNASTVAAVTRDGKAAAKVEAKAKAKAAKKKAALSPKRWVMPMEGGKFTSPYGFRWGRLHAGNDLAAPTGTPLRAMSSGTVIYTGWYGGGGNTTKVEFWDGTVAYYEHQSRITAKVGQKVAPGDIIGYVGNTGHSFGAHLHLEIHPGGDKSPAVDPHPWMRAHGLNY